MKKRIITNVIILILISGLLAVLCGASYIVAGHASDEYTKEELIIKIDEAKTTKENITTMANSARALGWKENDKLIKELQEMWNTTNESQVKYQGLLDEILAQEAKAAEEARKAEEAKWARKTAEYPAATQIWRYMKAQGWNDYVCAGIMGNLMTEVGGQTLDIRYTLSSNSYYGMCQWNRGYS